MTKTPSYLGLEGLRIVREEKCREVSPGGIWQVFSGSKQKEADRMLINLDELALLERQKLEFRAF